MGEIIQLGLVFVFIVIQLIMLSKDLDSSYYALSLKFLAVIAIPLLVALVSCFNLGAVLFSLILAVAEFFRICSYGVQKVETDKFWGPDKWSVSSFLRHSFWVLRHLPQRFQNSYRHTRFMQWKFKLQEQHHNRSMEKDIHKIIIKYRQTVNRCSNHYGYDSDNRDTYTDDQREALNLNDSLRSEYAEQFGREYGESYRDEGGTNFDKISEQNSEMEDALHN